MQGTVWRGSARLLPDTHSRTAQGLDKPPEAWVILAACTSQGLTRPQRRLGLPRRWPQACRQNILGSLGGEESSKVQNGVPPLALPHADFTHPTAALR